MEGSLAAQSVHGVLALVSVTLGQLHRCPLPWGFSLGGPGFLLFFFSGFGKVELRGNVGIKMSAICFLSQFRCLLFGVLILF